VLVQQEISMPPDLTQAVNAQTPRAEMHRDWKESLLEAALDTAVCCCDA
jgi:hypothetical protein